MSTATSDANNHEEKNTTENEGEREGGLSSSPSTNSAVSMKRALSMLNMGELAADPASQKKRRGMLHSIVMGAFDDYIGNSRALSVYPE